MPAGRSVSASQTRNNLRHMFDQWGIEQFSIIREQEEYANGRFVKGNGATVTYLRRSQWQTVTCVAASSYDENLRSIFLFLDRLRIAEKTGVAYQGLSSVKDVVKTAIDTKAEEQETLEEAYDILGVKPDDPVELVERVYRAKAQSFHPDTNSGDLEKMKRLNAARDMVIKAKGQKTT